MAYRLEDEEALQDGFRRAGREQLDAAIRKLTDGVPTDPVQAVHGARKALKKERSLLRLGRSAFDPEQRSREADVYRDAAGQLSVARDADVMVQALDDLAERFVGQVPKETFAAIQDRLDARREAERRQLVESHAIDAVADELKTARLRIDDWHLRDDGWSAIDAGLVRNYRRARKAFRTARAKPTPENLHAWRKRVKDSWYHLRLLKPLAPHTVGGQAKEAHYLSDLLGDDHDLSLLHALLIQTVSEIFADIDPVIGLIDYRRDQLQTEAFYLGDRLYAERPKAFRRRIHRYWKAWRAETRAARSRHPAELAEVTRSPSVS